MLERMDRIEKRLNITSNHTLKTENIGKVDLYRHRVGILERMDRIEKRLNITSNHTLTTENTGGDRPIQAQGRYFGEN